MRNTRRPAIWRSPLFVIAGATVVAIVALFAFLDVTDVFRLGGGQPLKNPSATAARLPVSAGQAA